MYSARVLPLLALFVDLVNSYSWDIVVGGNKRLKFYYNGTLKHTENLPSANDIRSITYDPVHYRVLFVDFNTPNMTISSFDLATRKIQPLVTRNYDGHVSVAYDPVTQLLFWNDLHSIYSFSLNPTSSNKAVDGNILVISAHIVQDIAVDSCGGYIYWSTCDEIERAAFDGSEREVLIANTIFSRRSLAIDQQTQKMYWTEVIFQSSSYAVYIESADLNGKNRRTLYSKGSEEANSLAISKDFIYWKSYDQIAIIQLLKNPPHDQPNFYSTTGRYSFSNKDIAANYTIEEQTQGTKVCDELKSLKPNSPVSKSSNVKVSGESPERTQNCTDEDYYVPTCQYFCFQGNCSVSAEGQPKCSCKAGYSGERCEVDTCYKHCLNNGVCFLNEEDEPFCECTADYEGERCDVAKTHTGVNADNTTQPALQNLRRALRPVIKEEENVLRFLQFFSDKIDEYEAKN